MFHKRYASSNSETLSQHACVSNHQESDIAAAEIETSSHWGSPWGHGFRVRTQPSQSIGCNVGDNGCFSAMQTHAMLIEIPKVG
jgi:hypothetical protein